MQSAPPLSKWPGTQVFCASVTGRKRFGTVVMTTWPDWCSTTFRACRNSITSRRSIEGPYTMRRRTFIKSLGALGATVGLPALFPGGELVRRVAAAPLLDRVAFVAPPVLPQVINVFLYGGASELAGNLTNIEQIDRNSQNPYPDSLLRSVTDNGGRITRHGFWSDAGGDAMEDMLASGDMTIYRTVYRRHNNTRAHRPSIFSCLTGNLDIDNSPGMGTTLAAVLYRNSSALGKPVEQMVLPFVSFEGASTAYISDPNNPLPLRLRSISLDQRFDNPYSRKYTGEYESALEELVRQKSAGAEKRYPAAFTAFENRRRLEGLIDNFATELETGGTLPVLPEGDVDAGEDGRLRYPDTRFTARIRAAVTLAIANPDSLFITVGGGLGGWDDHNSAIDEYRNRMQDLMLTLRAATKHIRYATRPEGTGNIIINVFSDFGRNVNLNNSMGWDHGNNQNLYTFGGAAIRPPGA
ncbi:MAG TPA: DUF1501 domain-containing protein, partial [Gammaproteobacteria bacterium]|nr:DUF1501 domain-containing protein [Gammaproteobacteria bacterium]